MDAVYVHLANEYYAKNKAPWVEEENLEKILDNAYRLEPTLIGKQAPEFTIYLEDGSAISLNSIKAKYTLLLFWAPDCGHCTTAMPKIIEFYEQYKDKGVEILSICNKTGDKYDTCWKAIDEKGMTHFINAGDQYQKSRIQSKYFVKSTPKIFILDSNKKIIMKNIGAEQLNKVMEEIIKRDNALLDKSIQSK